MLPVLRQVGYPAAYVLQDGQEHLPVPWEEIDAIFIGGSTAWKLGPHAARLVAQARARGKHCHMGRVNSLARLRYADAIGCHSADGTFLKHAGDREGVPRLLRWLDTIAARPMLPWAAA